MAKPEAKKATKAGAELKTGTKNRNKNRGQKRKQALSPVKKVEKTLVRFQ